MGSIFQVIEILSKEKGIDTQVVVDAVKDAMLVAARKQFKTTEDLVADFDPRGGIQIYGIRKVVEEVHDPIREISLQDAQKLDPGVEMDGEIRIAKPTETLGRISAQTAKQVILQKVREAERETIHSEYSGRVGELVNCTVKRIEGQDLIVDLGKTEARLPKKEQSRLENFSVGDRVRCIIKSVERAGKNAGVLVSRGAPELVMRLFEQEVPEIYDNTVVIKACAREAGERTKIAVSSRDRDVDSVGACVGMKGMRVQSIIRELRGEKIDIIEYSDEPVVFATHALSPAKISRVSILDPLGKHMEVIVDDTQLSLAIGKKGQNVRLAAKLLAWKIDIKSEEEKRQEVEAHMATLVVPGAPVSVLVDHGLSTQVVARLVEAGVSEVEKLGSMTPEDLEAIPEIGPELVGSIQMAVNSYYGQFETAPPAGQDEEVVLEEWNTETPQPAEPVEAVPPVDQVAPFGVEPASAFPGIPEEQTEADDVEALDDVEAFEDEQLEEAGISGLSAGDSTLQDLDEDEPADPGVAAVEGESDNR